MNVTPGDEVAPGSATGEAPENRLLIFYHRAGTVVSRDCIVTCGHRYPIAELRHVRVMHAQHSDLTVVSTLVALSVAVAIARTWELLDRYAWIGAITLLVLPIVLGLLGARLRRRIHVLLAEYRGHTTFIHSDNNLLRFNQVVRAIHRAQEMAADSR
ncbi:MAG: hypothetical protein J2P15_14520 [Micromonosporaceae bacterium]|nr:hypothetical protein [Micromonosporaceae bacterium]